MRVVYIKHDSSYRVYLIILSSPSIYIEMGYDWVMVWNCAYKTWSNTYECENKSATDLRSKRASVISRKISPKSNIFKSPNTIIYK